MIIEMYVLPQLRDDFINAHFTLEEIGTAKNNSIKEKRPGLSLLLQKTSFMHMI